MATCTNKGHRWEAVGYPVGGVQQRCSVNGCAATRIKTYGGAILYFSPLKKRYEYNRRCPPCPASEDLGKAFRVL